VSTFFLALSASWREYSFLKEPFRSFHALYRLTIQKNYDILGTIMGSDKAMPGKDITLKRRLEKTNPICRRTAWHSLLNCDVVGELKKRTQMIVNSYNITY
jgi:hypothetical protein